MPATGHKSITSALSQRLLVFRLNTTFRIRHQSRYTTTASAFSSSRIRNSLSPSHVIARCPP